MGKKSAPPAPTPPDPWDTARASAEFNRINQITPYGSLTFSGPNRNTATLTFNDELQNIFDQQLALDANMLASATTRQGQLDESPIDLSQFGPIQSQIDASNINFTTPQFGDLPNLSSPLLGQVGQFGGLQGSIGAVAPPAVPELQGNIGDTLGIQAGVTNPFDISQTFDTANLPALPSDPEQFRADVETAVFDRGRALLDPVFGDQERAMRDRLANQGIPEFGSEAFDTAQQRFADQRNRTYTDLANQAVISGGQEASRAIGDILGIRGQGFGEGLARGQFGNAAAQQAFNQSLQQGIFGNQAAGQDFSQALGRAGFGNNAALNQFGAGMDQANFQFGQNLQRGNFANQAALQDFASRITGQGFNNQTALQGLAADQGIRNQLTGEQFMLSDANNQAAQLQMALEQMQLQNQNAGRTQALNEAMGIRGTEFNEMASLLGLQQVQQPQMQNFFGPGQVDFLGAQALNSQVGQNNYQQQLAHQQAGMSGIFGLGAALLGGAGAAGGFGNLFNFNTVGG